MCSWGRFWTKDTERPKNPSATFKELGIKKQSQEQKQGTAHAPLHAIPLKGWADHLSPTSSPDPEILPYPHPK